MNVLALLVQYLNGAYSPEYAPERKTKMKRKVFVCNQCKWFSPGGWTVEKANCPWCKVEMDKVEKEIIGP